MEQSQTISPAADAPWGIDWASRRTWRRFLLFMAGNGVLIGLATAGAFFAAEQATGKLPLNKPSIFFCALGVFVLVLVGHFVFHRALPVPPDLDLDDIPSLHSSLRTTDHSYPLNLTMVSICGIILFLNLIGEETSVGEDTFFVAALLTIGSVELSRLELRKLLLQRLGADEQRAADENRDFWRYRATNWWIAAGFAVLLGIYAVVLP